MSIGNRIALGLVLLYLATMTIFIETHRDELEESGHEHTTERHEP
jgi:hypothetical protein